MGEALEGFDKDECHCLADRTFAVTVDDARQKAQLSLSLSARSRKKGYLE